MFFFYMTLRIVYSKFLLMKQKKKEKCETLNSIDACCVYAFDDYYYYYYGRKKKLISIRKTLTNLLYAKIFDVFFPMKNHFEIVFLLTMMTSISSSSLTFDHRDHLY